MVVADHSAAIQDRLSNTTVRKAINILHYCFKCSEDDIQWNGIHVSPAEMLENHPELGDTPADKVAVRFFGGPPGRGGFYNGTLYTLLADKIMWAVAHKRSDLINKFLQLKP